MANNLTAFNPTNLSLFVQDPLHKSLVARGLCSERLEKDLTKGSTVDITRVNPLTANAYTDANGVTPQDATPGKDTLTINGWDEVTFDVSRKDKVQNKISAAKLYSKEAAYALEDKIDTAIFTEMATASTNTITVAGGLTTSNVVATLATAGTKLREQNVKERGDWFCAISPADFQIVVEKLTNAGFNTADKVLKNGSVGEAIGFEFFISNNLPTDTMLLGKKKALDFVLQDGVNVEEAGRTVGGGSNGGKTQIGKRYITDVLYGYELTTQGEKAIVKVDLS